MCVVRGFSLASEATLPASLNHFIGGGISDASEKRVAQRDKLVLNRMPMIRNSTLITIVFLTFIMALSIRVNAFFKFPFPPFNQLVFDVSEAFSEETSLQRPLGAEGGYRDLIGLMLGMRRLTADIAWIGVLQYYGGHESSHEDHSDFAFGKYPALKIMVRRVTQLDPSFYFAYLYGAGSLAFNLNRPGQALELLEEGIRHNPTYWRLRLYAGAIIYKQKGRYDDMIKLLEDAIQYTDCPTLVKSVLANIYKARKNYLKALEIWIKIAESENLDPWYQEQSVKQIKDLKNKLGLKYLGACCRTAWNL